MRSLFKFLLSRPFQIFWLISLIAFPFILWILPGDYFDNGKYILCPSRLILGIECFGCGLTRAVMHFHHFQYDDAVYYNLGVYLAYPVLVVLWIYWVFCAYKRVFKNKITSIPHS